VIDTWKIDTRDAQSLHDEKQIKDLTSEVLFQRAARFPSVVFDVLE